MGIGFGEYVWCVDYLVGVWADFATNVMIRDICNCLPLKTCFQELINVVKQDFMHNIILQAFCWEHSVLQVNTLVPQWHARSCFFYNGLAFFCFFFFFFFFLLFFLGFVFLFFVVVFFFVCFLFVCLFCCFFFCFFFQKWSWRGSWDFQKIWTRTFSTIIYMTSSDGSNIRKLWDIYLCFICFVFVCSEKKTKMKNNVFTDRAMLQELVNKDC